MRVASAALAEHRALHGPAVDPALDINVTGLIGSQFSPITSTVGDLEAKRTTTNPDMAGLLVLLLTQAGVRAGDFVAVGASGSFPALILATLCAAQALDLEIGLIVSLAASQWGANLPNLTWLDMEAVLTDRAILPYRAVAASIGGDADVGRDLSAEGTSLLRDRILRSTAVEIEDPDLASNVLQRVSIYQAAADGHRISAFVNIGGASANLGIDASILDLPPGVARFVRQPSAERAGVIHAMAADGVPVVHLLNIKELSRRFDMPWDPSPLPSPGTLRTPEATTRSRALTAILAALYLAVVTAWLLWQRFGKRGSRETEGSYRSGLRLTGPRDNRDP